MTGTCDARAVGNATGCCWNINVSAGHLGAINVAYPERPLLGLSWRRRAKNVVLTIYSSSRSSERTKRTSLDDRALKGFPGPVEITLYSFRTLFLRRVHDVCTYYNMELTTVYFHISSVTRPWWKPRSRYESHLYIPTRISENVWESKLKYLRRHCLDALRRINLPKKPIPLPMHS